MERRSLSREVMPWGRADTSVAKTRGCDAGQVRGWRDSGTRGSTSHARLALCLGSALDCETVERGSNGVLQRWALYDVRGAGSGERELVSRCLSHGGTPSLEPDRIASRELAGGLPSFLGLCRPAVCEGGAERDSAGWEPAPLADLISGEAPSARSVQAGYDDPRRRYRHAPSSCVDGTHVAARLGHIAPSACDVHGSREARPGPSAMAAPFSRTSHSSPDGRSVPGRERRRGRFYGMHAAGTGRRWDELGAPAGGDLANDRDALPGVRSHVAYVRTDAISVYTAAETVALPLRWMDGWHGWPGPRASERGRLPETT